MELAIGIHHGRLDEIANTNSKHFGIVVAVLFAWDIVTFRST